MPYHYLHKMKFFTGLTHWSCIKYTWPSSMFYSSVTQSCPTLCNPMSRSIPGLPVYHQVPESTQTHVHQVGDAIQPSHPLSSPSPPTLNLSQHQGLFQWVSSLHQVAKVLEFQLQHQSFRWFQCFISNFIKICIVFNFLVICMCRNVFWVKRQH